MAQRFPVKTREQVAAEYGATVPTLKRWLQRRGIELPRNELLYPGLQARIYEALGYPQGIRRLPAWEDRSGERRHPDDL